MSLKPRTEQELAEAIAGATGPLRVQGGGTRDIGRPVAGEPLEVAIAGVELYEPGALTLVVRAGTPLAEVEALLASEGQRLAFEPMDHRVLLGTEGVPTIGGVVAANVSGPRRIQVGAARDFALGARFVDGSGRALKNGGRVMKNVTGYDLVKLLAGSWGTLGVLSEVSLKVLPVPETEATLVLHDLDGDRAGAAMRRALNTPWDVSGAACAGLGPGRQSAVLIRIEGFASSVAYRAGRLAGVLGAFGEVEELAPQASRARWAGVRDVAAMADLPFVARASVPADRMAAHIDRLGQSRRFRADADWGGGLIWVGATSDDLAADAPTGADSRETAEAAAAETLLGTLRDQLATDGRGHVTLVKAPTDTRAGLDVFQPQPVPLATISRGLKQKFDPRGILNPGLMGV